MKKITQKLFLLLIGTLSSSALAQITPTGLWNRVGDVAVYTVYNDTDATDGVADGALKIDGMTVVVGQGITFAFDGTMQNGTNYTINTAIYNDTPGNFSAVKVSLWNTTDNVEVASANSGNAYTMNNTTSAYNLSFSYSATSTDDGDKLELRYIRTDPGEINRNFEIDFAQLNTVTLSESYTPTSVAGNWSQILNGAGSQNFALVYADADNGDGAADGAIRANSQVAATNLGAAYTFDQPMVTGQTYSINTTVYNGNTSACPFTSLTLWNKTDNVQVASYCSAFSIGGTGTGTYGFSIRNLKSFNYTATASDAGDIMELRYLYNATATSVDLFIDNITLNGDTNNCHTTRWKGTAWDIITPTSTTLAQISGNYSSNLDLSAMTLTIDNDAMVTIPSGYKVTLGGALNVVSGSFTLENNAKLIQTTDAVNTGSINVKRNSTPMVRLDYTLWSSPVTAQNLFAFSPATITSPITRFYSYNTGANNYDNTDITSASTFVSGKGYAVRAPNTYTATPTVFTGTFAGVPNNGPISIALDNSNQGFNLVGNPYPSPIDALSFVNANSSLINGTLYFYSHNFKSDGTAYESGTGIQYATWNSTGAAQAGTGASAVGQNTSIPNGTIQVGQGFIVKATAAGNLSFTNAMRSTNSADQFFKMGTAKKPETTEKHRFWLDLTNEQGDHLSQMLVGYVDGATNGEDNLYDGEEFGNPQTSLSSRLNGKNYTIQGRALPFIDTDVVPLDFKAATNGTYTIALTKTDGVFASNQKVVLKDNATGKVTDLKAGAYTFSATAGSANSRFELLYDKSAINKTELAASTGVIAVKKQGVFQVNTTDGSIMKEISVYDIQGHLILKQENINSNTTTLSGLPTTKGIFILKVTNQTNQINTIKIIN